VLRAELPLPAAGNTKVRPLAATRVVATLVGQVHPVLLVLRAELPRLAAGNTEDRNDRATRVDAPRAHHIHHPVLLVLPAELPRAAAGSAIVCFKLATGFLQGDATACLPEKAVAGPHCTPLPSPFTELPFFSEFPVLGREAR